MRASSPIVICDGSFFSNSAFLRFVPRVNDTRDEMDDAFELLRFRRFRRLVEVFSLATRARAREFSLSSF